MKVKLDYDYSITMCSLIVIPEVRSDVEERLTGDHRDNRTCRLKTAKTSVSQQKQENTGSNNG